MSIGLSNAATLLADFEVRDDLETVTLDANANVHAVRRKLSFRQVALGGTLGLQPTDIVLCLGCKSLAGTIPKRGDTLTDSWGVTYTLLSSDLYSVSGVPIYYEAICTKQVE